MISHKKNTMDQKGEKGNTVSNNAAEMGGKLKKP